MSITFGNNNDVIAYALAKIICYARSNQYIFVAQCVWWLASIIGLQQELVIDIDHLRVQTEACPTCSNVYPDIGNIHPNRVP
jgi:hypothetical protein